MPREAAARIHAAWPELAELSARLTQALLQLAQNAVRHLPAGNDKGHRHFIEHAVRLGHHGHLMHAGHGLDDAFDF